MGMRAVRAVRIGSFILLLVVFMSIGEQVRAQSVYDGSYTGAIVGGLSGPMQFTIASGGQPSLTGTADVGMGSFPLVGSIDGAGIFFSGTPPGELTISFSGTISIGGQLSGIWSNSDFSGTFSGAALGENVEEVTVAQAVTAINATGSQRRNYYRRIENVRSGAGTGLSVEDLALNFRGVTITPEMLMSGTAGFAELARALGQAFDAADASWSNRGRREFADSRGWWTGPDYQAPVSASGAAPGIGASNEAGDVLGFASSEEGGRTNPGADSLLSDVGVFLNGAVSFSERDAVIGDPGFDAITFGLSSGVDRRFGEKLAAGAGIGYTRDGTDFNFGGTSTSNAVYGVIYGTAAPISNLYLDGILSVGWIGYDIDRQVTPIVVARGETDGAQLWGGLTSGYNFVHGAATLSPYFRLNGGATWIGGYTETGAGAASLVYADNTIWSLSTVLALRFDYAFGTPIGVVLPYVRLEYEHEFGDAPSNDVRPIVTPGGQPTTFGALNIDRNFFNVGGGISMNLPRAWAGYLDYDGLFGADNLSRHTLSAGLRKEF